MPSTNNANNLTRHVCPLRAASGGYEEDSSDVQNNTNTPKCQPSAFSKGLPGRPSPLVAGYSDDSDLPRLSPIRTSSGTALNTWERKQKLLPVAKESGRCAMSRSCLYEAPAYKPRPLFVNGGMDSSDLSLVGSLEESITATSGAWSALSEDVWQNSPLALQTTETSTTVNESAQLLPENVLSGFVYGCWSLCL